MEFYKALDKLISRSCNRICRTRWNGKNQYVTVIEAGNAMYTKDGESGPMQVCIGLRNAQGLMQPGWVPSQGDLFADDWEIYDK